MTMQPGLPAPPKMPLVPGWGAWLIAGLGGALLVYSYFRLVPILLFLGIGFVVVGIILYIQGDRARSRQRVYEQWLASQQMPPR